jgi:hypothetical protein
VQVRGLVFAGVQSAEPAALARFLSDVLGLPVREDEGVLHLEGEAASVAVVPPGSMDQTSDTILGFLVDDVDAAVSELATRGIEAEGPLVTGERYRWRKLRAPDGRVIELLDDRVMC